MSNQILLKRSSTANSVPTTANLALGELAINTYDGNLFTKINNGSDAILNLTQNQTITLSGDVTGSGQTAITTTLANSGVTAGTYGNSTSIPTVTVDSKGRVTSISNNIVSFNASNITNGTSNVNIGASGGNVAVSVGGTANVAVFATTGEYITGLLSVTGNVIAGNVSATNHTGTNVSVTGTVTAASTVGGVITGTSTSVTGTQTAASTVGGVITGTSTSVTGTQTAASTVGGVITGTSTSVTGTQTAASTVGGVITGSSTSVTGNVTAAGITVTGDSTLGSSSKPVVITASTGQISAQGNFLTTGSVSATGNITGSYLIGNGSQITGLPAGYSNTNAASFLASFGSNTISTTGTINAGNITGGNILSTGLISTSGNIVGGGVRSTSSGTAPASPTVGDFWYDTTTNVQYRFTFDGTNYYWIDDFGASVGTGGTFSAITNGTSSANIGIGGGNLGISINGTSNVGLFASTGLTVNGDLTVTGNATLSGNILGDRIQNGTTLIDIQTQNGNANITVGGTSNVAVFATTGAYVTGVVSATGNITGSYIIGNGSQLTGLPAGYTNANLATLGSNNVSTSGTVTAGSTVGGVITGTSLSVSGTVTGASHVGSVVSVTSNITGGNVNTGGIVSSTGNIYAGSTANLQLGTYVANVHIQNNSNAGNITMLANIGGLGPTEVFKVLGTGTQGVLANGIVSATGTVTAGNVVVAVGNIGLNSTGVNSDNIYANTSLTSYGNTYTRFEVRAGGPFAYNGIFNAYANTSINPQVQILGNVGSVSAVGNISSGNLSVGTGTVTLGNIINANGNGVGNIGSSTTYFNTVFAKATSAQYADLAEKYTADEEYPPGTVVIFDGDAEVTQSTVDHDSRVAGIVSTNPSYIMNAGLEATKIATVALTGRVPCQVQGPVTKGQILVSGTVPGTAMAIEAGRFQPGVVIGKSLEVITDNSVQTIEVAVGRF